MKKACAAGALACSLLGCAAQVVALGSNDGGAGNDEGGAAPTSVGSDAIPPECANPGPFTFTAAASSTQVTDEMVGTWVYCGTSIFVGAEPEGGAPQANEVGIIFRADYTWQKLGASGGQLVELTSLYTDFGTWSITDLGGPMWAGADATSSGYGVAAAPTVSPDGRSMIINTSAGGHTTTLAKAIGTQ